MQCSLFFCFSPEAVRWPPVKPAVSASGESGSHLYTSSNRSIIKLAAIYNNISNSDSAHIFNKPQKMRSCTQNCLNAKC